MNIVEIIYTHAKCAELDTMAHIRHIEKITEYGVGVTRIYVLKQDVQIDVVRVNFVTNITPQEEM